MSKVIIRKSRGEHFFEQKLRFGLVLGRMAVQNKNKTWADYEQLLRAVSSCLHGKKKFENIVASALKSCIEKRSNYKKKNWEVFFSGEKPFFLGLILF